MECVGLREMRTIITRCLTVLSWENHKWRSSKWWMVVLILMLRLIQMHLPTKTEMKRERLRGWRFTIKICLKSREWNTSELSQPKRTRRSSRKQKRKERSYSGSRKRILRSLRVSNKGRRWRMLRKKQREIRSGRSSMQRPKRSKEDFRRSFMVQEAKVCTALDIQLNSHKWSRHLGELVG